MNQKSEMLTGIFTSFGVLTPKEVKHIVSLFSKEEHKSGSVILNVGDVNEYFYFIEKGILREFAPSKDELNPESDTHWIMPENNFTYIVSSFMEQVPSKIAIEAIDNTILWKIHKNEMDKLYFEFPQLNIIGRIMTEAYLQKYESYIIMMRDNSETRYKWFCEYHPELANRIPLKYIASYLNIRPETLSRIRKKLML